MAPETTLSRISYHTALDSLSPLTRHPKAPDSKLFERPAPCLLSPGGLS